MPLPPHKRSPRRRRPPRRFWGGAEGATALEFALLALPFLVLLFQILELSLVSLVSAQLDTALANAARAIRTGAFQESSSPTPASFTALVCRNMGWLQAGCTSQMQVDVRTEASFTNPNEPDPMAGGSFNKAALAFAPGTQNQIVLVRVFYTWPLILPVIDAALSRDHDGNAVLVSTTIFNNENYT